MRWLVILTWLSVLALPARAVDFPAPVTLPSFALSGALEELRFSEVEFPARGQQVKLQGRIWRGDVEAPGKAGDARATLAAIVGEMQQGGWEVMMRDDPANPPMATFKLLKDGKEFWALVSIYERPKVTLVAVGPPPAKNRFRKPSEQRLR